MKRIFSTLMCLVLVLLFAMPVDAGTPSRRPYGIRFQDEGADHGTPPDGFLDLYVNGDTLYVITDAGTKTSVMLSGTAWDDLAVPDANEALDMTTYSTTWDFGGTVDMFVLEFTGAFGDVSGMLLEQKTGNPTDGTLFEMKLAVGETDPDFMSAKAGASEVFNLDAAGTITIAGTKGAGTTIDANSLDFIGAGTISAAASSAITINPNAGNAAGEDLIITAHNIQLTATGAITMSPDAAVTTAITITDTDYTNALSVGANAILGTTGIINYDNFDVDASGNLAAVGGTFTGNVIAVDGTFSGNVAITGTFNQDAITAVTAATTLTVDGTGAGGVTIGGTSEGTVTLGGGAVLVNLPSTVDLVLAGGDFTMTDTANADLVQWTNDTMTTADILQISAAGTRTSGNVINITDGATSANSISVTANALTSGTLLYLDSDRMEAGSPAGYYIQAYDGNSIDFSVGDEGKTVIDGVVSTDVLTITAGDVQITAGDIDLDLGIISVDNTGNEGNRIARNNATGATAVLEIEQTDAGGGIALLVDTKNTTAGEYAIDITSSGATQIHFTANGAAGDGMLYDVADAWTGQAYKINAGAWLGTLGEGSALDFRTTSAATAEAGQAIYIKFQGTGTDAAAINGKGLYIEDEGAVQAGSYLVALDSLANAALHINNAGATADGIKFDVANAYTGQGIVADLGPHVGTVGEGFINIESDATTTDVAGQILRINLRDTTVDTTAISGKAVYAKEVSAFKDGTYVAHLESTSNGSLFLSGPVSLQAAAPLVGASPLVLEGATADAFETIIAVTDPAADNTYTIPDAPVAAGEFEIMIVGGTTTDTETAAATETIDESTVAIPAAHAAAGQVYKWIMAGTKTGTADTFSCQLDIAGTNSLTLTSGDAAAGDWVCEITLLVTGTATQKIYGTLNHNGKVPVVDYATDTVDISGAVNVGLELILVNAADEVSKESVLVYYSE